eukprot:17453_1
MRGPVKKLQRCYAKCQSDYRQEAFPTSAHVLDIIRCSLVFEDVPAMLHGMHLFEQKLKLNDDHECSILQVVRVKNGFASYTHEKASYTDIKFNVIVRGPKFDVIGEMQFLIKNMFDFKKIAHSLYSIERTKEFVDDLSEVLPVKLNLNKQLFIHSARNNLDGVTDLLVTHGFNTKLLLQLNQKNQSIFTSICSANRVKLFKYLLKIIPPMQIKERLVFPDQTGAYPLKRAITNNHYNGILKCIFNHKLLQKELINYHDVFSCVLLRLCLQLKKSKCALLILNTVQSEKVFIKMIAYGSSTDITFHRALGLGDMECLQVVFDQLKRDKKIMQQLLDSVHNFYFACSGGSLDCLKLLISECDKKQRANLWIKDYCFGMPIVGAIRAGSPECTSFLLCQMNDDQKQEFFGETHRSLGYLTPFVYLTRLHNINIIDSWMHLTRWSKGHVETLKVLLSHVPNDHDLGHVFLYAARNDDIELGKLILTKSSNETAMLNIVNMSQSSCALHACAEYNSLDFLKYLFEIISADNSQFVMKQNNEKQNEWYGYTGLMIAATKCNIKCCQLILDHLKYDGKLLNQVLKMKNNNHATALELASISTYKNNTKCVQTIIEYYADDDIESVFTPCVQLGDLQMVQSIWNKAGNDIAIQNKLLSAIDKDNNNCFLLAAKNGNEACLEWLLTLNQEEAERLVMQKHIENGMTALILAVSNDDRRKDEYKMEERRNYFECVQLMFDAAKNKKELLFEVDNNHKNALMYSCANANIQTTTYLLSQIDEKDQTLIIEREDTNKYNCFHYSVMGGNIDLVRRIFKDKSLMEDDKALLLSLQNGYIDITEWILFSILHDTNQKVMFLNQTR